MVNAERLDLKLKISLDDFLDLLAYERRIPEQKGDILYSNNYVAVLIPDEENNLLRAYVLPPEQADSFLQDLKSGPITGDKFTVVNRDQEDVDPSQLDPLAPYLPKGGIYPAPGSIEYKTGKPMPGSIEYKSELSSGSLSYNNGKLLQGQINVKPKSSQTGGQS